MRRGKAGPGAAGGQALPWELSDGYGFWDNCLAKYAEVLGVEGLAAY